MIHFVHYADIFRSPPPRGGANEIGIRETIARSTGVEFRIDEDADYEDWIEPASILAAAIETGHEVTIHQGQLPEGVMLIPGTQCADVVVGRLPNIWPRTLTINTPEISNPDRYAETNAFWEMCGREIMLCNMPGERDYGRKTDRPMAMSGHGQDIYDTIAYFAGQKIVIKQVRPSKEMGILVVDVPSDADREWARKWFMDEVGYHMIRYEGDQDCMLVQQHVPMRNETRFFVIDGKVVSGAACIEEFTPADRDPKKVANATSIIFEGERNDGKRFTDVSLALTLHAYANKFAKEVSAEDPLMLNYVVDVAMGEDGPLIIEMNPLQNSGLYANDPALIVRALLRQAGNSPELFTRENKGYFPGVDEDDLPDEEFFDV